MDFTCGRHVLFLVVPGELPKVCIALQNLYIK